MIRFLSINEACRSLLDEKVIAVPTETVYGLAGLATSPNAVEKIFSIKNRPASNPLICHFHDFHQAVSFLDAYPSYVDRLVRHFSPGPVSYLLPLKKNSGLEHAVRHQHNVIVRIPSHPVFLELLRCVGKPLAAPSANTSGKYSPTSAQMVADDLGDKVDGILDGGKSESGLESTIIDCTQESKISILRPGAIGRNEIIEVLSSAGYDIPVDYSNSVQPTPGSLFRHYAPATPVKRIESFTEIHSDDKPICILVADELADSATSFAHGLTSPATVIALGSQKHPETIGRNLYRNLAALDALNATQAYIIYPHIENTDWQRSISHRLDKITAAR